MKKTRGLKRPTTTRNGTLIVDKDRERRLAQYLAEEAGFEEMFEEESSNDDSSSRKFGIEPMSEHVVQSPRSRNTEVLDLSGIESFESEESDVDSVEEELWKRVRELSLVNVNRTPSKHDRKISAKSSPKSTHTTQSSSNKKRTDKKISSEENARFLSILNGSFPSGKGKNDGNERQSQGISIGGITKYGSVSGSFVKNQARPNQTKTQSQIDKFVASTPSKSISHQEQLHWREPNPLICSDSEDTESEFGDCYSDSNLVSSTRINIQGSKPVVTPKPITKSMYKNRFQNTKCKEDNERLSKPANKTVNIYHINRLIDKFVKDPKLSSIALEPMNKQTRRTVHLLANVYNLKSKSKGAEDERYPILYRTKTTRIPSRPGKIQWILHNVNCTPRKTKTPHESIETENPGKRNPKTKTTTPSKGPRIYNHSSPIPPIGSVVGQFAKPIGESNIGHQMLQKMGWSPGEGLTSSSSSGRITPVEAVIRGRSRVGLGGVL